MSQTTQSNTTLFTRHYKDNILVEVSMDEIKTLIEDESNQALIAEYVYERFYNRFLKIFDFTCTKQTEYTKDDEKQTLNVFNEEFKNGFLIMASCSLLIETFASFLVGQNVTPKGDSVDMFKKVFEYAEQKDNELKIFKNQPFYGKIRCGILHQGETYGKFTITRSGSKLFEKDTVNAYLFHQHLKTLLGVYKNDLTTGKWDNSEWDNCRNKIRYIVANGN